VNPSDECDQLDAANSENEPISQQRGQDIRESPGCLLKDADIGYRIITGGCFLRHDVIKYFDYDTAGEIVNANIAHDRGFFVGNHPRDLTAQIERFHQVLDRAAVGRRRSVVSV